jgi:hypothetical protein
MLPTCQNIKAISININTSSPLPLCNPFGNVTRIVNVANFLVQSCIMLHVYMFRYDLGMCHELTAIQATYTMLLNMFSQFGFILEFSITSFTVMLFSLQGPNKTDLRDTQQTLF